MAKAYACLHLSIGVISRGTLFPVVSKLIFLGLLFEYGKRKIRIVKKNGNFLADLILPLGPECQKDESGV